MIVIKHTENLRTKVAPYLYLKWGNQNDNKKKYNMIHHLIIGGFIDVYIVVRFVWF